MSSQLPQFELYHSDDEYFFQGWQSSISENRNYQLKLVIPKHYPDQRPNLYITYPVILPKYKNQGTINSDYQVSHAFHTCRNGPGGCVQICHFNPSTWDATRTCVGVFFKGMLWLIAYEYHLTWGKSIDENIREIKRRQ